jgi:hypothetical protein
MVVAAKYTVALSLACVGCVLWRSETPFGDSPSLPSILLSERTVRDWLSRVDKDAKEARNKRIFDMWLACYENTEVASVCGCDEKTVRTVIGETADLPKLRKDESANAEHTTDFTPPIYNIWKQQEKTSGSSHFGNSEVRWVDNLLYLYTNPFDVVLDPFAGGGSTIDICKRRFRRNMFSDRKPIVERETEIRQYDLIDVGFRRKVSSATT